MNDFDRDHVRPPTSSTTPVRQPEHSGGQPLVEGVRDKMAAAFGHDFSTIRVHADQESAAQAHDMGAQAFTVGTDIHFAAGRYQPQSEPGQRLLAHELAHAVQQSQGGVSTQPEHRADAAAERAVQGGPVSPDLVGGAAYAVQMKPDEPVVADPNTWSKNLDRFGLNSPTLTGEHRKALDALAAEVAAHLAATAGARATITITGHTDTSGDEQYNEGLGLKRAHGAKAALEAALRKQKVGADRVADVRAESAGETGLAKDTPDNTREPLNRRVEITVKIEGPAPTPAPVTAPAPEERKRPIDLNLPKDYKLPEESWWERTERERKAIEEFDRTHPRKPKSATDVLVDIGLRVAEPVIKKLPKWLAEKAREGIRKGIEAGTEKACEAAIDRSGVTGQEAEALKAACKAALKTKPGEKK